MFFFHIMNIWKCSPPPIVSHSLVTPWLSPFYTRSGSELSLLRWGTALSFVKFLLWYSPLPLFLCPVCQTSLLIHSVTRLAWVWDFIFLLQNPHLAQSFRNLVCRNPSCTPINGSPEPPKACKSPRQVNGISNWLVLLFLQVDQCVALEFCLVG